MYIPFLYSLHSSSPLVSNIYIDEVLRTYNKMECVNSTKQRYNLLDLNVESNPMIGNTKW